MNDRKCLLTSGPGAPYDGRSGCAFRYALELIHARSRGDPSTEPEP